MSAGQQGFVEEVHWCFDKLWNNWPGVSAALRKVYKPFQDSKPLLGWCRSRGRGMGKDLGKQIANSTHV